MKKMCLSFFFLLWVSLGFLSGGGQTVSAAAPSFSAQIVQTMTDDDSKKPYFDLTLEPNETRQVQISIQNMLKKTNELKITPTIAITNDSGHAVYNDTNAKRDPSLKYAFPDLTDKAKTIKIPGNGNETVTFNIKAPAEPFQGIIMGAYTVKSLTAGSVASSTNEKVDKHVQIGYSITTLLHSKPTAAEKVTPELKISDPQLTTYNTQPQIMINVHNVKANYLTKMTATTKIYQNDNKVPLITDKQRNLSMAANSNFDFTVPWKTGSVIAGSYRMVTEFKTKDQHWRFNQKFLITQNEATKFNKKNVKIKPNYKPWIIMTTILLVVVILSFSWILYYKGQQRGQKRNSRRKKR
ncbi:DUF916 and DUF3324 domain-containing protein [Agrilactobacillus yilanensis]|uniref:DUF916 and DUF3324 domain-containing protein n=1 Tax=Agrilactobacillus yilanensis TaxID=2485997 RepID=A0ABW4J8R5_9LACO|nr:DUF916 and DUF3324 domain-containing protein [Agrilactobacillus yilanensis]